MTNPNKNVNSKHLKINYMAVDKFFLFGGANFYYTS